MTLIKIKSAKPPSQLEITNLSGALVAPPTAGVNWKFVMAALSAKISEIGFDFSAMLEALNVPNLFNDGIWEPEYVQDLGGHEWDSHIVGANARTKQSLAGTGLGYLTVITACALIGQMGMRVPIALGQFGTQTSFRHKVLSHLDEDDPQGLASVPIDRTDTRLHASLQKLYRGLSENERLYLNEAMAVLSVKE